MSLHSIHCSEIQHSLESGHHCIHSTWGSKLRDPLTYLLLREGYSWGACGKLAYFFNRILGTRSLLEMIWRPWSFPRVPVLKLVFLYIWDGYIRESLYLPIVRQANCLVGWGMGDCTRYNTRESGIISNWFGLHQTISHSFGDISVILDLWGYFGDSLEFYQANQGSFRVVLGTWICWACNAGELCLISRWRGSLIDLLNLRQEPGVYSRVMVG